MNLAYPRGGQPRSPAAQPCTGAALRTAMSSRQSLTSVTQPRDTFCRCSLRSECGDTVPRWKLPLRPNRPLLLLHASGPYRLTGAAVLDCHTVAVVPVTPAPPRYAGPDAERAGTPTATPGELAPPTVTPRRRFVITWRQGGTLSVACVHHVTASPACYSAEGSTSTVCGGLPLVFWPSIGRRYRRGRRGPTLVGVRTPTARLGRDYPHVTARFTIAARCTARTFAHPCRRMLSLSRCPWIQGVSPTNGSRNSAPHSSGGLHLRSSCSRSRL